MYDERQTQHRCKARGGEAYGRKAKADRMYKKLAAERKPQRSKACVHSDNADREKVKRVTEDFSVTLFLFADSQSHLQGSVLHKRTFRPEVWTSP